MILPTQPRQVKTARVSVPGSVCKRFGVSIKQQVRVQKRQMTQIRSEATCGRDVKTFRALEATELGEDFFESIDQYNGTLLFFAHTLCPFAERTWLTLLEKGIDFTLVHVDLSNKPSWYHLLNPKKLVPCVRDKDGEVIVESLDICQALDDKYKEMPLTPTDPALKALMETQRSNVSAVIQQGLATIQGNSRQWGIGSEYNKEAMKEFEAKVSQLFDARDSQTSGSYLVGDSPTLVDIALFPFMYRFELALQGMHGTEISHVAGGRLGMWLDAMRSRESAKMACPNNDLFREALKKHASLDFFDYETYSIFALHPQLAS